MNTSDSDFKNTSLEDKLNSFGLLCKYNWADLRLALSYEYTTFSGAQERITDVGLTGSYILKMNC